MGQDARFGQAEAVQPAAVAGVGGFARLLRGGIHQPGGVHAAGAHAQHDAVVIVEQPRQAQLGKKVVLGGHMAAAQHHKAAAGQQGADLFLIAGVAGHKFGQGQVGVRKALQEYPAHLVVLGVSVGVCRDGKAPHRVVRPHGPQVFQKMIASVQYRNGRAGLKGAAAGAAGQK